VIFYMLFTWYMKSMTEDVDLELTLKDNVVEYTVVSLLYNGMGTRNEVALASPLPNA